MSESILTATGLTMRFKKTRVLEDLDFDLKPGKVTVLLGRNGAGKSTFMKLALGVLAPKRGRLKVCGLDPLKRPRVVRQRIGFVPDRPDCYRWMTPRSLYRFLAPQYPTWNPDHVARCAEALEVPMDRRFENLSRGEGTKAMLVAALAHQPPLLLLDEPFAGLDPIVREEVLKGVIQALRGEERTVLCATHDLDVAARIADRVALLSRGRIETHGPVGEILGESKTTAKMRELLAAS